MRDHTKLRAFELAEIAFGSLRELHYQFGLARRLGYTHETDAPECGLKMLEIEKVLGVLIRSMRNTNSLRPTA